VEARRFKLFIDVLAELKEQLGDRAARTRRFEHRQPIAVRRNSTAFYRTFSQQGQCGVSAGRIDQLLVSDPSTRSSTERASTLYWTSGSGGRRCRAAILGIGRVALKCFALQPRTPQRDDRY